MNNLTTNNGYELDLLTVPEAAKMLRISRNLAYELVARNELPAVRLGRVIRVPKHGLTEWLDRQVDGETERSTRTSGHGAT
ncbi:MAG: helix-turn-helix domain-containing protein [Dehalococcoidia bacterium]|nr:helix-turn-helix domain-containing protein [Dehalococcoidia bacterium]